MVLHGQDNVYGGAIKMLIPGINTTTVQQFVISFSQ